MSSEKVCNKRSVVTVKEKRELRLRSVKKQVSPKNKETEKRNLSLRFTRHWRANQSTLDIDLVRLLQPGFFFFTLIKLTEN